MPRLSQFAVLLVALPLALGACRKKPPAVVPTATPTPAPAPDRPRPAPPVETPAPPPAPRDMSADIARARALLLETVYFEYDSDAIRADAQASLEKKIPLLAANTGVRLRVAGHCDDRGSDEYNIALGKRRAESVKRFLTDRGIDASRVETVSFGRERPAVQGDNEDARARNRRDEFEIIAGGDMLRVP